jgi:DNA/RNA endonuclease G (NUC1)
MRLTFPRFVRPLAVTIALLSCTENGPMGPAVYSAGRLALAVMPAVRFSEIHYDNVGTDAGEAIEISGPAGTDVTGWQILLYNGSGGAVYDTKTLGGTIPATCDARGVIVTSYPSNGIQNGSPDGMALVDGTGAIVEFLSYEGTMTAVGGAANGLSSHDIVVTEDGTGPIGQSLQRNGSDVWAAPAQNTFGACNDNDAGTVSAVDHITVDPATAPAAGTVAVGATLQFTAHVFDGDGNDISASNPVTWSTSPTGFATISSSGLATGTNAGITSVVAAAGGRTGSAPLTVTGGGSGQTGDVVISQIYGGGGNSGATYHNDYIELLNRSSSAVNVSGWAVQYASATGTSWAVTQLTGTIQPGHYLLVQEAAGTGAGSALPTADVTGTINLSGTAGKVILTSGTVAQSGACPSGAIDRVGFGTTANCVTEWGGNAPAPSNTTAAIRKDGGCTNTNNASSDFTADSPAPRNSSNAPKTCVATAPLPAVHFSELHYDNTGPNNGLDVDEKIEIEGPANRDLTGWSVVLYGGDAVPDFSAYSTTPLSGSLPVSCGVTGVTVVSYPVNGIKNAKFSGTGNPAGMALVDNTGAVVEFLSYEGTFTALNGPAAGIASTDIGVAEEPPPAPGNSLHRNSGVWSAPSAQDFGVCNGTGGPPPGQNHFTFSGRLASDPALPVGFEDQLFATEHDGVTNATITTTVTWSSDTPGIATIDGDGVFRGVSEGTAVLRATATDGTTTTTSLPVVTNTFSATADWSGNLEFGTPTDANPDDDFIITHDQFTSSYSLARDIPNWVSAKLAASHYGTGSDRCDCFTFDPAVPSNLYYTTNAWTGVGTQWNRGHLLRSADVESSAGDNSIAYYFSNIAPQSAEMNQGPWAVEENFIGDMAHTGGKDVYEIMGVSGSVGTLKNEGRVTIPAYFWKVAVIVPHGRKLADIHSSSDLQVISVIMPNIAGVNADWMTYKTTVHAVEQLSGYNLLDKLPDDVERSVEDAPPTAVLNGDRTGIEGGSVSFDASGSTDADDAQLSYAWDFGDGTTGSGARVSHSYADNGQYIVKLTVTDPVGLAGTASNVVSVSNVSPSVVIGSSGPIPSGSTYTLAGGFADPGQADAPWSYTINWGDGISSGTTSMEGALGGTHRYLTAGTYIVTLTVTDKDGGSGSASTTVQVARILGTMSVGPSPINIDNSGNGQMIVTVFGTSAFDGAGINLSTVRIGQTAPDAGGNSVSKAKVTDVNHDGILDLVVHFVRGDLVTNGDLSSDTRFLLLDANLNDGRQIEVRAPVEVTAK